MTTTATSEAAAWFVRLQSPDVTEGERSAFEAWLRASPEHVRELRKYELIWNVAPAALEKGIARSRGVHAKRSARMWQSAGVAAVLALVFVVFTLGSASRFTTERGERLRVSLEDGSTVELNTATSLTVKRSSGGREIALREGEAFFEVEPDPDRPFIVRAGAGVVRVHGTAFNVRRDGARATIVVDHGTVEVGGEAERTGRLVEARQAAKFEPVSGWVVLDALDLRSALAWRNDRIILQGATLQAAVDEFNRYGASLSVGSPAIAALEVSGAFRTTGSAEFVRALAHEHLVRTRVGKNGETVLEAPEPGVAARR